jgi:hypothetical protein
MNEILLVELAAFSAITPFIILAVGWMRRTTKTLADLNLAVAEKSARQDTTLDDHERRITDLEHPHR